MNSSLQKQYPHSWEGAIAILRGIPEHQKLIFDSYLTANVPENCRRFAASDEFHEVLRLIALHRPATRDILDIPGGNGIASFAFAQAGFAVTTVEPDPSDSVGRGAIASAMASENLHANIVDAFGEELPFPDASFDAVYVRQGLHHARDLPAMLAEYRRVLRPKGLLVACREHVVDDYGASLQQFLDTQVDHQLYGGENAFTLQDYQGAIENSGLRILQVIEPYDSPINLHPNTIQSLGERILETRAGRILRLFLPRSAVIRIGLWRLRAKKVPGRNYSFVAQKSA